MFRNLFIRLAGHNPGSLAEQDGLETTAPVVYMGETVALCALVAAANWGIAVHNYADGIPGAYVWPVVFAGAMLGFGFVTVIDKFAIHCLDCLTLGWFRTLGYFSIRAVIIMLVSAVTTEAAAPWFLQKDLKVHAYHMVEQSSDQRQRSLKEAYPLEPLRAAIVQSTTDLRDARQQLESVPADVVELQKDAQGCWRTYASNRAALISAGWTRVAARGRLRSQAARCVAAGLAAKQALARHVEHSQTLVAEAETGQRSAKARFDQMQSRIDTQAAEARDVERQSLTPGAAVVLSSLLASDRGAWWRYHSFRALLITIELMPLLLMAIGKRSVPGVRVGIDREIAIARHKRFRDAVLEEQYSEQAVREMMTRAMHEALTSTVLQQHAMRHFQSKIDTLMPIDVAKRLISQLESSAASVERTARNHPNIARTVTEIWSQAMSEVIAAVRGRPVTAKQKWTAEAA